MILYSLHSLEARRMMDKYRIGRIEGRWNNFLPPIQGGRFRARVADGEQEQEDEHDANHLATAQQQMREDATASSSSDASSRSPSPVFDNAAASSNNNNLRNRKQGMVARSESATSLSSLDDATTTTPPPPTDGMAHLDALTRKEIKLDLSKYPSPHDPATQDAIVAKYRRLHSAIQAAGLYDCNYTAYAVELARYTLFFGLALLFLHWRWYVPSAVLLGCFWHQLVFTAHDAGHMGITHDFQTDTVIGIVIADFLGGLSLGWWKRSHNVHHIVTNMPEHDPDIEHMPFFAISHRFLGGLTSTYYERVMEYDAAARFFVGLQHYLYYVVLLFGRFNLYRLSWVYLLAGQGPRKGAAAWHRWLEIAGQVFFWTWFGYGVVYRGIDNNWDRFWFVMISHWVTTPVHVQITLSHFAMSTADLGVGESFPQKMLRTTMDVDCPPWLDFFHGGLQFQAIHHLFPRIPRHNLRKTQRLVQEFCDEVGIPYALYGFVDGNKEVIGRLADVARQAAIFAKCQSVMAAEGGGHHHH
jgi:delta8-fatty-acid desaturase